MITYKQCPTGNTKVYLGGKLAGRIIPTTFENSFGSTVRGWKYVTVGGRHSGEPMRTIEDVKRSLED